MAVLFPRVSESRASAHARRRAVVYVTQNSEYHCVGNVCVGVRDLETGKFVEGHPAVGRRVSGAIRFAPNGEVLKVLGPGEPPSVGDHLFFSEGSIETEIQTSPLRDIKRASKDTLTQYLG